MTKSPILRPRLMFYKDKKKTSLNKEVVSKNLKYFLVQSKLQNLLVVIFSYIQHVSRITYKGEHYTYLKCHLVSIT